MAKYSTIYRKQNGNNDKRSEIIVSELINQTRLTSYVWSKQQGMINCVSYYWWGKFNYGINISYVRAKSFSVITCLCGRANIFTVLLTSVSVCCAWQYFHYNDVIMSAMASQITSLTTLYSTVYSGANKKHQNSASLAFVRGIHQWPVNSPHKGPVTRKMFPFDDGIMLK